MNEVQRLRAALAKLSADDMRKIADKASVPLRSLNSFAAGEKDDLPYSQFVATRAAYRSMILIAQ